MTGNGRVAGAWMAFTLDTDEAVAVRRFTEKHGHAPVQVVRSKGLLLVGPVDGRAPVAPTGLLRRVEAEARPLTPERARQLILNLEEVQQC